MTGRTDRRGSIDEERRLREGSGGALTPAETVGIVVLAFLVVAAFLFVFWD